MASSKEQPCFHPSVYQNIQSVYEIFDDNFFTVETQVNAHHPLFVRIYKERLDSDKNAVCYQSINEP